MIPRSYSAVKGQFSAIPVILRYQLRGANAM